MGQFLPIKYKRYKVNYPTLYISGRSLEMMSLYNKNYILFNIQSYAGLITIDIINGSESEQNKLYKLHTC